MTGASGLLGMEVLRSLLLDGHTVVGIDLHPDTAEISRLVHGDALERLTLRTGDVTDLPALLELHRRMGIERTIHLASVLQGATDRSPVTGIRVNVLGVINVLEAAVTCGAERVVCASSVAVYGADQTRSGPLREDAGHRPTTLYGQTKSLAEAVIRRYADQHDLVATALRFPMLYGRGRSATGGPGLLSRLLVDPVRGEATSIPHGDTILNWLHVTDAARACLLAGTAPGPLEAAYNIVGDRRSIRDAAAIVRDLVPAAVLRVSEGRWDAAQAMYLDGTAAGEDLDYRPAISLEEGLRRTVAALREA